MGSRRMESKSTQAACRGDHGRGEKKSSTIKESSFYFSEGDYHKCIV